MQQWFCHVDGEKMLQIIRKFTTVHELLQVVDPQILRSFWQQLITEDRLILLMMH